MTNKQVPSIRFAGFTDAWEQRKIDDVFTERSERSGEGELISVTINSGVVRASQLDRKDNSSEDKSNYKKVKVGDIAYNSMRMWQGASGYSPYDGILSPAYTVIIPREDIDSNFFAYDFKRYDMIQTFKRNSQGLTSDTWNLKFPTLKSVKVMVPCIEEQTKISNFFKQLDDTIALHQRELDLLKEQKKGFLQKMFPKKDEVVPEIRFAGFTDAWEQRKWIDTVDMSTNMVDPKSGEYDELLHIGPGNIESFTGRILNNVKTVKEDTLISGKFHFKPGDIIYGKINPQLAKFVLVDFEGLASADAYVLNSKNGVNQMYLFYVLQSIPFYKYSVSVSMRTGMPKINRDELNQFIYLAPNNIMEQEKIGNFFKQLDDTIVLHQRELEELKEMKKGFLQKMFV